MVSLELRFCLRNWVSQSDALLTWKEGLILRMLFGFSEESESQKVMLRPIGIYF